MEDNTTGGTPNTTGPEDPTLAPPPGGVSTEKGPGPPPTAQTYTGEGGQLPMKFYDHWFHSSATSWKTDHAIGHILYVQKITPFGLWPELDHCMKIWNTWTGGLDFNILLGGTGFHGGKLVVFLVPPNKNPYDFSGYRTYPNAFIDAKQLLATEFTGTDQRRQMFHYTDEKEGVNSFGGHVVIAVYQPLIATSTGSSSLNVMVRLRLAKDFEVAQMVNIDSGVEIPNQAHATFWHFDRGADHPLDPTLPLAKLTVTDRSQEAFHGVDLLVDLAGEERKKWDYQSVARTRLGTDNVFEGTLMWKRRVSHGDNDLVRTGIRIVDHNNGNALDFVLGRTIAAGSGASSAILAEAGAPGMSAPGNPGLWYKMNTTIGVQPIIGFVGSEESTDREDPLDLTDITHMPAAEFYDPGDEGIASPLNEKIVIFGFSADDQNQGVLNTHQMREALKDQAFSGIPADQVPTFLMRDAQTRLPLTVLKLNREGFFTAPQNSPTVTYGLDTIDLEFQGYLPSLAALPEASSQESQAMMTTSVVSALRSSGTSTRSATLAESDADPSVIDPELAEYNRNKKIRENFSLGNVYESELP